jgi:hypothetical protein
MFILFGLRTRSKVLARLLLVCNLCGRPAAQTVYRRMRWFTLFFIPVIPISRHYRMQCALCGQVGTISKEDADRLVAMAAEAAPSEPEGAHEALPAAE